MRCCLLLVLGILLPACSTPNKVVAPRFVPETGDMIATLREPVVFAHDAPHLSISARDYLYIGPVEVTRNGVQQYFLWVGVASTLDSRVTQNQFVSAPRISLELAGERITLPLSEWTPEDGQPPYRVAAPVLASLRAPIGFDDLQQLLTRSLSRVTLHGGTGSSHGTGDPARGSIPQRIYHHWRGAWTTWPVEADEQAVGFKVDVQ